MRRILLAAACAVAVLPAGALANPSVTLEEQCERAADGTVLNYGVSITFAGFPANSQVSGSVSFPGGGSVSGSLNIGPSGTSVFRIGTTSPGVFTVRLSSPIVFEQSLNVTCAPRPTSKQQCKDGGWRRYGVFKNQGDCVSFVATGGRNAPAGVSP